MIPRDDYIEKISAWKDNKIKVITGMRRSGKLTILKIYIDHFKMIGVSNNIVYLNFEDLAFEQYQDYKVIYKYLNSYIKTDNMYYVFLDVIKLVDKMWIYIWPDLTLKHLSGEISTLLSGRYIEIKRYPLLFSVYLRFVGEKDVQSNFENYLKYGGMP